MAEKSSKLSTPERMKALLSSFIHTDVEKDGEGVGCKDKTQEESAGSLSRSYQPRNKEAYFARVATFSELTWFAKPIDLSPLKCAQYGWENTSKDVLKCVSCRQLLCAALPLIWDPEIYPKRHEELKEGLHKAHSNICAWADSPSPDSFLSVPVVSKSDALRDFKARSSSLIHLGTRLPILDPENIENEITKETKESVLKSLLRLAEKEGTTAQDENDKYDVNQTACLLSLCGWTTSSTETSRCHFISCQFCNRRAGLWNFFQLQSSCQTRSLMKDDHMVHGSSILTVNEPMKKKFKVEELEKKAFNPITEHRLWCPWVTKSQFDGDGQQGESKDDVSGWQLLLGVLIPSSASPNKANTCIQLTDRQQTPPNLALKVRKIFDFLQTPSKKN